MMSPRLASLLAFALTLTAAASADAHITMTSPTPRHSKQKLGPCGVAFAEDARGSDVTTFMGGETITVTWNETVNHPGHYRISLDLDGFDDFADPATADELYTNDTVLLDGIEDKGGGMYSAEVTLPDVDCDTCTLQLIQLMTDKPPYGDGNDLYYQCADLVIMATGMSTTSAGTDSDSDGTGTDTGTSSGTGETSTGSSGSSSSGGSSSGSDTGSPDSSSSGGGSSTGSGTGSGDSGSGDGSSGVSDVGGDQLDEGGCSCTSGGGSATAAGWWLALFVAIRRRRRCG
jgi:MYXO-CTERM domain-containing protein